VKCAFAIEAFNGARSLDYSSCLSRWTGRVRADLCRHVDTRARGSHKGADDYLDLLANIAQSIVGVELPVLLPHPFCSAEFHPRCPGFYKAIDGL